MTSERGVILSRRRRIVAACVGVALALCGCGGKQAAPKGMRVVSLVPSVTEIICAVGAGSVLVGNTNQDNYPEAAKSVYKVGDFMDPDMERILALKPTLVVVTLPIQEPVRARLEELRIPVYVSRPKDIEAVFTEIDSVGKLVGAGAKAQQLVAAMRAKLDSLPQVAGRPRVFIELSATPLMTCGAGTFVDALVTRAGGENVFGSLRQEYPVVDPEAVVKANPDVILLLHPDMKAADVAHRVGWQHVSAVIGGRIYDDLDEDLFFRPGPRMVDGITLLARLLLSSD
jgi:iron complex transport system substrate-binding protein